MPQVRISNPRSRHLVARAFVAGGVGLVAAVFGDQFEGAHGTKPANVAHRHALALGLDGLQLLHDDLALLVGLRQQVFSFKRIEHAQGCRTGNGVAGIGAADARRGLARP